MMRRYTSSFVFFVSLLSSLSSSSRVLTNVRLYVHYAHVWGGFVAANTPVVYTNDLSRHTGTRRGEPVKKDQQCGGASTRNAHDTNGTTAWRRTNSSYGL